MITPDISPKPTACPKCGATRQQYAGKVGLGWALIHRDGCDAMRPEELEPR